MNILRRPETTDRQPRIRKGQPPQSTIGVDRSSCIPPPISWSILTPGRCPPIASMTNGSNRTTDTQNRRVKSISSGLDDASAVTSTGSNTIPQSGQSPVPAWITSGCIGHVYCALAGATASFAAPSSVPISFTQNRLRHPSQHQGIRHSKRNMLDPASCSNA